MAIKLIKLWGHTERPWGYEIRAIFREEGKIADINIEMTFKEKPEEKELEQAIMERKEHIETQMSEVPSVPAREAYSKEEVAQLILAFKTEIIAKEVSVPEVFKDIVSEVTKPVVEEKLMEVKK